MSNLKQVQFEVIRQHEACDLLESLTGPDGLFADREALDRARDRLRRWITDGKIIRLDDVFAVRIRVQAMDSHWGEAKLLDDIGSTGTRPGDGLTCESRFEPSTLRNSDQADSVRGSKESICPASAGSSSCCP